MNKFVIERHTIPAADSVAFHVVDDATGEEMGRFLFEEQAMALSRKLNRERLRDVR